MFDIGRMLAGLLFLAITLATRSSPLGGGPVHTYRIPSSSMEPTLRCARPAAGCTAKQSDDVTVKPARRPLRRGDLVAFHTPPPAAERCGEGGTYLKRVIGVPGDTLVYDGRVLKIDGKRVPEPYVKHPGGEAGVWKVPAGAYFVLGDNRAQSCDSRVWGPLPERNVIGVVTEIFHH
jgi:signal peptidase I